MTPQAGTSTAESPAGGPQLRHLQRALIESERRYRSLSLATGHAIIFVVNRSVEVEYASDPGATRFGFLIDDIAGRRLQDVMPGDAGAETARVVAGVFETGAAQTLEARFDRAAGEHWLEISLVPLDEEDSKPSTVMAVARDITARKMLERQLLQAQKMEAVGRLAGGIAHDFNNLLTAILGYSELLQDRVHDMPDVLADVAEIRKAGERASRLTRQLLAFSRKQPMTRQVLDLGGVLGDLKHMLGRVVGEDVELSVSVEPAVWQVIADPVQLEQILLNLVVNARDAMPKGGRLTIAAANAHLDDVLARRSESTAPGDYVSIAVSDTGCGMTPEVRAHAFEPFFTTKPVNQGTGLGLSTVYGIVKQEGGYVTIESTPAAGTAVTIYWPRKRDHDSGPPPPPPPSAAALAGTETILLVEDEAGVRELMRRALEPYGYRIAEAKDVYDALRIAEEFDGTLDLLLSDVIMPGLNGPDLAQRIVANRPQIKVVYVSGFPNSLLQEPEGSRRRLWFLPKPFTPQALATKVRECLDS